MKKIKRHPSVSECSREIARSKSAAANFPRSEKSTAGLSLSLPLSLSPTPRARASSRRNGWCMHKCSAMIIVRRVASPTVVDAGRTRPSAFTRTLVPCSPRATIGMGRLIRAAAMLDPRSVELRNVLYAPRKRLQAEAGPLLSAFRCRVPARGRRATIVTRHALSAHLFAYARYFDRRLEIQRRMRGGKVAT